MEQKSYQQMRKDFYNAYQTKIVPSVSAFENERKTRLVLAIAIASLLFLVTLLFLVNLFFIPKPIGMDINNVLIILVPITASLLIWNFIQKGFEKKVKTEIMPIVCQCFEDLTWQSGEYPHGSLFMLAKLVPNFTKEHYDDIFRGSFKNVKYEIIEAKYGIITKDSEGHSSEETVFQGVIIRLDMNKKSDSHTIIKPNSMLHISPSQALKHTTLEDVEFEKKYDVYTNDEVEARYLITPAFMERLKNMKTAFAAQEVSCAFYQNSLFIAMSTSDLFSICSLTKPVNDSKQFFTMYEEIVSIIKLIDHFKLDQKTGL